MNVDSPIPPDDSTPALVEDVLPDDAPAKERRAETAAKWFVIAFLTVVPVIGFGLVAVVCYALWQRFVS
jgi:hypothetical protein